MTHTARRHLAWSAACVAVLGLSLATLRHSTADVELARLGSLPFPRLLTMVVVALATLVAAWALVVTSLTLLGPGGRRLALVLTPRLLHGTLLAGLCGALAVGPAHAEQEAPGSTSSLDGLRLPDRIVTPPPTADPPPAAGEVVVRVGDSLWRIAQRRSPGAKVAQLARDAAALHARNRTVIGPDPDLVQPGQHLRVPQGHR